MQDAPLIQVSDLMVYLNDPSINSDRAIQMIDDATTLCRSVVAPLPDGAALIVKRVAARGYLTITSARQEQLEMSDGMYGTQPGPIGGVYLTRQDRVDLRNLAGAGGGAFSINMLAPDYAAVLPPQDVAGTEGAA